MHFFQVLIYPDWHPNLPPGGQFGLFHFKKLKKLLPWWCTFSKRNLVALGVKSSIFCLTFQFEQLVKEAKLIQLGDGGEDWDQLLRVLQEDQSMLERTQEDPRKGTQEDPRDRHALQAYTTNRELLKKWKWYSALTIGVLEHTHIVIVERCDEGRVEPAKKSEKRGSWQWSCSLFACIGRRTL